MGNTAAMDAHPCLATEDLLVLLLLSREQVAVAEGADL